MAEKQDTRSPEERKVEDLPEKKLSANEEKAVRGGIGPIDAKKPPILPYGPVDGSK